MLAVLQGCLVKRPLRLRRGVLHEVTLFPMFTCDGKVEYHLLFDHVSGELYLVEWRSGLFSRSWWSYNRLGMFPEELDGFRVIAQLPGKPGRPHVDKASAGGVEVEAVSRPTTVPALRLKKNPLN